MTRRAAAKKSKTTQSALSLERARVDALEERFVNEYLRDFDGRAAAIRAGVPRLNARAWARRTLSEQHVALEVNRRIDEAKPEEIISKNRIIANLARVANSEFDSGRVAALRELAAIFNLRPERDGPGGKKGGLGTGGVIRVPTMLDIDEWERLASEQQTRLKALVRE